MSATSTEHRQKQPEQSAPSQTINEVFHESMRGYEKALKTGVELQEQSLKMWSDVLNQVGTGDQFQNKLGDISTELIPAFRKQMEEIIEASNMVSDQSVAVLRKSAGLFQANSIPEAQRRLQEYLEAVLGATRVNIHVALNTTAKMMNFWGESAMNATRSTK